MIEVSSIDAIPGESEILTLMANYMTERLFTKRQRRSLTVFIDVTRESVREPVTRRMLGPQKAGLGTRAPTNFEMTVSTGAGLRDAAEVIAHELLHISQAVNGRLLITEKTKKINGVKKKVDLARWMGGKPIMMDELAWHQRPWEIEACGWQGQLVTEFLMLTTGQSVDQPVQSPKRKQLALYPVSVPAPMSPVHQEPVFAPGNGVGEAAAVEPRPKAPGSVVEENGASIDALIDGKMPLAAQPVAVAAGAGAMAAGGLQHHGDDGSAALLADFDAEFGRDSVSAPMPGHAEMDDPALDDDLASAIAAVDFEPVRAHDADAAEDAPDHLPELPATRGPAALPDAQVYSKPVIEVEIPGLDETRSLQRDSITRKLRELQKRGLASADIAGL
ncbi:MAG: hypothetical protein VYE49_09740, partial [Pseudomonadota bacterium]|nr:hypothetical protein [Pseudomonadota bacterium]